MSADGAPGPLPLAGLVLLIGSALIGCEPTEQRAVPEPLAGAIEPEAAQPPQDQPVPSEPTEAEQVARILPGPDFELLGLDGESRQLSDLRGRVVLINFWATWCASCRGEMPDLDELHAELGDRDVSILGIATDRDPALVGPYVAELGIHYPILLDPNAVSAAIFGGVEGYPKTFILDREGLLYSSYLGARGKAVFEEDLRYLLKAPPSPAAQIPR